MNLQGAISQFALVNDGIYSPNLYDFLQALGIYVAGDCLNTLPHPQAPQGVPLLPYFLHYCANHSSSEIYLRMKDLLPQVLRNDMLMAQEDGYAIDVLSPDYIERFITVFSMVVHGERVFKQWGG